MSSLATSTLQPTRCPMCGESAADAAAFRDHLAETHHLVDDEGTDTVRDLQDHTGCDHPQAAEVKSPSRAPVEVAPQADLSSVPAAQSEAVPGRLPNVARGTSPDRYPLALRYGDIGLYVPGIVMLLAGIAEGNLALDLLGASVIVLAMLIPVIHRRSQVPDTAGN